MAIRRYPLSAFAKGASSSSAAARGGRSRPLGRSLRLGLASSNLLPLAAAEGCYEITHLRRRLRLAAVDRGH